MWFIDGSTVDDISNVQKDLNVEYTSKSGIASSVLTMPCKEENNNSEIYCSCFGGGYYDNSKIVTLLIQGLQYIYTFVKKMKYMIVAQNKYCT